VLAVLRTICVVVGALTLYCGLTAALWSGVLRLGRRRARAHADRRAAARAMPVAERDTSARSAGSAQFPDSGGSAEGARGAASLGETRSVGETRRLEPEDGATTLS
jgi:hypothetical protein